MRSLLIADNEKNILEGLDFLLKDKYCLTLCSSGKEVLEKIKVKNYDLILLDVFLGDMCGNDVLRKIKEKDKDSKVVMLSGCNEVEFIVEAIKCGALDYILKPFDNFELKTLIDRLSDESIADKNYILNKRQTKEEFISDIAESISSLSENEKQVLHLLHAGKLNKEIGVCLKKSENYIKNIVFLLYIKLGVKNRIEAINKTAPILHFK